MDMMMMMTVLMMLMDTLVMTDDYGTTINALLGSALQLFNGMSQCHKAMQGKAWQGNTRM